MVNPNVEGPMPCRVALDHNRFLNLVELVGRDVDRDVT
jgi:hypothetical protein